jgi:hypothetical protein
MRLLILAILAAVTLGACAIVPDDDGGAIGIGIGMPIHHGWR